MGDWPLQKLPCTRVNSESNISTLTAGRCTQSRPDGTLPQWPSQGRDVCIRGYHRVTAWPTRLASAVTDFRVTGSTADTSLWSPWSVVLLNGPWRLLGQFCLPVFIKMAVKQQLWTKIVLILHSPVSTLSIHFVNLPLRILDIFIYDKCRSTRWVCL